MSTLWRSIVLSCLAVVFSMAVGACSAFGPGRVPGDRFDYSAAIARSEEEQMLTNLVRLRYLRLPEFLEVSSVLTQYTYTGGVGIFGQRGFGAEGDVIGGNTNFSYAERPTIAYAPLTGREFAKRMLNPISIEFLFSAGLAGCPTDLLSIVALQRINAIENMSFGAVPAPGDRGTVSQFDRDVEKFQEFKALLEMQWRLVDLEALEAFRSEKTGGIMLQLDPEKGPEAERLVAEYKRMLGLDPALNLFRITDRDTARQRDEITIQARSLLAIMSYLSRGVEVPREHAQQGRVVMMSSPSDDRPQRLPIPFEVKSRPISRDRDRPADAFVAIRYEDHWFYIDRSDIESKRTFGIVRYIYSLQAPDAEKAAPLLSLPTG